MQSMYDGTSIAAAYDILGDAGFVLVLIVTVSHPRLVGLEASAFESCIYGYKCARWAVLVLLPLG